MFNLSRHILRRTAAFAALAAVFACGIVAADAQTVKTVRDRGTLQCGINKKLLGFSSQDGHGRWIGFDVEFCRAMAAAVLGDADKVQFVPLDVNNRFTALQGGAVDILVRNSTWTIGRETEFKIMFPVVTYYDGQGFMARKDKGFADLKQLDGGRLCVLAGTTHETYAADYFESHKIKAEQVSLPTRTALMKGYMTGLCDAMTSDVSGLYAMRREMVPPNVNGIFPVIISKEPLGPAVRQGDDQWFSLVRWVHFALVTAEEKGITAADVKSGKVSAPFMSPGEDVFQQLGLAPGAELRIIGAVGNYGELYDRNLGKNSDFGIPRGLNALARDGGLQYAPRVH